MNVNDNFGGIRGLGVLGGQTPNTQQPKISSLNLQKGASRTLTSLNN